jgi:hypothetical protein
MNNPQGQAVTFWNFPFSVSPVASSEAGKRKAFVFRRVGSDPGPLAGFEGFRSSRSQTGLNK